MALDSREKSPALSEPLVTALRKVNKKREMLINRASDYLKELDPSITPAELNEDLLKFCEFFPGGATQFFMEYVKDYYLFDIEDLYSNGSPFSPDFSTERERDGINWAIPRPPKTSHFLHDYKTVEISMHEGLRKLFSRNEFDAEAEGMKRVADYYRSFHTF